MRTKLVITIEVEEDFEDTLGLFNKLKNGEKLTVKELFNPDSSIVITQMSTIESVPHPNLIAPEAILFGHKPEEPKETTVNCIMYTRGVI